jgi:hypothetical protein
VGVLGEMSAAVDMDEWEVCGAVRGMKLARKLVVRTIVRVVG